MKSLKKKILPANYNRLKEKYSAVEIGFMDEMRVGLIPIVRKVWSEKGKRPVAQRQIKYEWLYVYSLVFPSSGNIFTLFISTVNVLTVQYFFNEFKKVCAKGNYLIVWDNAGFHQEIEDSNFKFLGLPSYSPELNPVETLWPFYRSYIANKVFKSIDSLCEELIRANDYLIQNPDFVKSQTYFHWIKNIISGN